MNARVLCALGEEDLLEEASRVLEEEGIEVVPVNTSTDAVRRIEEHPEYDTVVSGYRLSEGDGLELLESVRKRHPELPFIMFTEEESASVASQAISTGVTDYILTEEIDSVSELVRTVKKYVEEGEHEQPGRPTPGSVYVDLLEESPAPIAVYDVDGELVYVNKSGAELMDAESREQMIGNPITEFVHPSDRDWAEERLKRVINDREKVMNTELRLQTLEGETVYASVSTEPVTYHDKPAGQTVLHDVTENKNKEQEFKEEEQYRIRLQEITSHKELSIGEKIRRVLQLSVSRLDVEHGHLVKVDLEEGKHETVEVSGPHAVVEKGDVTDLDTTYCRKTVKSQDTVVVRNAPEEGLEEDPAYRTYGFRCYIGSKITVDDELYGTICFVDTRSHREFTYNDKIFVDLVGRWVSHELERAAHNMELRQEKELYRSLVDSVDNYAIYRLDPEGYVVSWNEGAERIKGYTEREALDTHYSEFYTEAEQTEDRPWRHLDAAKERGSVENTGWRVRKDGSKYWADETVTSLWNDEELRGYSVVTRDLTEQKWMEERKNVTEDILTHNTRNWANVILGGAETLSENVMGETSDTVEECIQIITESAIDILELNETSRIIQESVGEEGGDLPTQRIDVAELLQEKIERVQETDPRLEIEFDSPATEVVETSRHLGFAAEKLMMDTRMNYPPPRPLLEVSVRDSGDTAVIRFTDNGSGFPEEEFDMIDTDTLSEFYESGGIWIWLMKWIVKESMGDLEITEDGSTVKITLPKA